MARLEEPDKGNHENELGQRFVNFPYIFIWTFFIYTRRIPNDAPKYSSFLWLMRDRFAAIHNLNAVQAQSYLF
jgi:hypothetical protein